MGTAAGGGGMMVATSIELAMRMMASERKLEAFRRELVDVYFPRITDLLFSEIIHYPRAAACTDDMRQMVEDLSAAGLVKAKPAPLIFTW